MSKNEQRLGVHWIQGIIPAHWLDDGKTIPAYELL